MPVGTPIISIRSSGPAPSDGSDRQSVLVGYGVRENAPTTRRERRPTASPEPSENGSREKVRAKPPVRKLARDLGIDLAGIAATGPRGEVTRADVLESGGAVSPPPVAATRAPVMHERIPVRGVQRAMADAMVQSAFTAPHVTEWVDVDMSRAVAVVSALREHPACAGIRITPMILVCVALIRAAAEQPIINSTWEDGPEGPVVVIHGEVNLGVAADTPRGLLVPTIKSASMLGLVELARRVQELIDTAREGKSTPADLTGGTITVTNIGVFGIDGGTPILNPGQTAILAMGRILDRPWVVDGAVVPRPVMQLSLSFDHRVIDGATGSRALRSVADFLADPALALLLESGLT